MSLVDLIVLALATWRLSSLLVGEDGPFDIFRSFRSFVGAGEFSQAGMDAERLTPQEIERVMMNAGRPEGFLAGLLSCVWCTSIWVALALALAVYLLPTITFYVALVFALSTMAILVQELVHVHRSTN